MIKISFCICMLLMSSLVLFGQSTLDFGSTAAQLSFGTGDIVNASSSGANDNTSFSFDVWDESTMDYSMPGGGDDITFEFQIIHAFDQYGTDGIIDAYAGSTHDINQSTAGLRGDIPMGNSGANETSAGDVRGYSITVDFASHMAITANELIVALSSVNSAGSAHEATSVVFLDASDMPYGTANYDGYYSGATGASIDGSCTAPSVNLESWSVSPTGVWTASSTGNVDVTDACNPIAGTNGSGNNHSLSPVLDAGLNPSDVVGGFIFTVYLEDVAASTASGANTSTSTGFISTLEGLTVTPVALPVSLADFSVESKMHGDVLTWKTLSEEANDFFEVQWSDDGVDFQTIGTIQGIGNSATIASYSYEYADTNTANYYRLKQVDTDGSYSYSVVVHALRTYFDFEITPTLVDKSCKIYSPESDFSISIYDSSGSVLLSKQFYHNIVELDLSHLKPGMYYVHFLSEKGVLTKRIVKA